MRFECEIFSFIVHFVGIETKKLCDFHPWQEIYNGLSLMRWLNSFKTMEIIWNWATKYDGVLNSLCHRCRHSIEHFQESTNEKTLDYVLVAFHMIVSRWKKSNSFRCFDFSVASLRMPFSNRAKKRHWKSLHLQFWWLVWARRI